MMWSSQIELINFFYYVNQFLSLQQNVDLVSWLGQWTISCGSHYKVLSLTKEVKSVGQSHVL